MIGATTVLSAVTCISLLLIAAIGSSPGNEGFEKRTLTPSDARAVAIKHPDPAGSIRSTVAASKSPAAYSGQYLEGVYYSGTSTTSTIVEADIAVPLDSPPASDFYYVVVSAWDSSNSYDFVGFADNYGSWQVVYLSSSPCPVASLNFSPTIASQQLTPGLTYRFAMSASSGIITFSVSYASNGTSLWSTSSRTGGWVFDLETAFTCTSGDSGISSYGYFDYEDVRAASNTVPPYNFHLQTDISNWTSFSKSLPTSGPVAGLGVWFSNNKTDLTIANEQYYLQIVGGPDSLTFETNTGSEPPVVGWGVEVAVDALGTDSNRIFLSESVPGPLNECDESFYPGFAPYTTNASCDLWLGISPGVYDFQITAIDGSGSYNRISYYLNVLPALALNPHGTPGSGGIDVGQPVVFSAGASGGAGGYTYSWSSLPPGCSSSTSATIYCSPTAAGTFTVNLSVNDSLGYTGSGSVQYEVFELPSITSFTTTATQIAEGRLVTFTVVATQGSGSLSYNWNGLPTGCRTTDSASLMCIPTAVGSWGVSVSVTDSNHGTAVSTPLSLTVHGSGNGTVTPQNGTGAASIPGGVYLWIAVAASIVAVATLSLMVVRLLRGGKPGPPY
jgi:hypothetical protein